MEENQSEVEEIVEAEDFGDEKESNWFKRNIHVLMISIAFHMILLFIISLIPTQTKKDDIFKIIITDIVEIEELPEPEDEPVVLDTEVEIEVEVVETQETEDVIDEIPEMDDSPEQENEDEPEEQMVDDVVPEDNGALAMMGLEGLGSSGLGNGSGSGPGIGNRLGEGKETAIKTHNVTPKILNAVDKALKWLAEHQEKDGSWDVEKYEGKSNGTSQEAVSACAILAFLGAGHSERIGDYKDTVRRGMKYLNRRVSESNSKTFGKNYGSGIILMALSEATIFGSSSTTETNANILAERLIDMHKGQGWHYGSGGRDFSVSGWVAMGLKSAKMAKLRVMKTEKADKMWESFTEWVGNSATSDENGFGNYHGDASKGGTPHMTWVGIFMRRMLDFPSDDKFLEKATEKSIEWTRSLKWVGSETPGDCYGIYYATLSAFQQQGMFWKVWDAGMRKSLIPSQIQGSPKELGGSWNPTKGHTGHTGGRVLTTSLFALCLEVYYRYALIN